MKENNHELILELLKIIEEKNKKIRKLKEENYMLWKSIYGNWVLNSSPYSTT